MARSRKKKRTSGGQSTGAVRRSEAAPGASPAQSGPAGAGAPAAAPQTGAGEGPKRPPERRDRPAPAAVATSAGDDELTGGRRIAWWALLAMVFVVPVAMGNLTFLGVSSPVTWDSFDMVKMTLLRALSLVALAAWAWDMLRKGGRLRHTPVDWLVLAFLAWVALTTVTSVHVPTAVFGKPRRYEGLLSFLDYALIYFLVLQFVDSTARLRRLAQVLFWSSVVVAVYGILQYAGRDPATWGTLPFEVNRAFSTYGNPDLLGALLIFTLAVALGLALVERRPWWRLVYWVGFGLNGLALIVAFTRGAWIGGAVALVVLGAIAWRQRAHLARIDLAPLLAFVAAGVVIVVRSLSSTNEVMNFGKRLASIFEFGGGSGQTRTEIWQAALAAIRERPVLGWGADTFRLVFPEFKPVEYVRDAGGLSVADNAHDYPLQLATGVGVPGMLLFYAVVVWAGVRSFSTVFRRSDDPGRLIVGAFWAAAAGYLVQLFFGVSVTGVTFLLWIALAVALAPTARLIEVRAPRLGTAAAVAAAAACFLGVAYSGVILAADSLYMQSQSSTDALVRVDKVKQAVALFPYNQTYRWGLGVAYSDLMNLYLQAAVQAQEQGEDPDAYGRAFQDTAADAEQAFKDAIAFVPQEYDNYVSLADVYNALGESVDRSAFDKAVAVAEEGLRVEPYGTAIRQQLARALVGQGKDAEAEEVLRYTVGIDPRGGQAALMLASLLNEKGQTDEALALLEQVEAVAPGQTGVAEAIATLKEELAGQE